MKNKIPHLSEKEKYFIKKGLQSEYAKNLNELDQIRLKKILPCVFWAEKQLKEQGKKITRFLEKIAIYLGIESYVSRTLGPWNFNKQHATRFGFGLKEFNKVLKDFELSTNIVIRHLCEDIGLDKEPSFIFAEYNAGIFSTKIAGLQNFLNSQLHGETTSLVEDGLWGENTFEALKRVLPSLCSKLETINSSTLDLKLVLQLVEKEMRHPIKLKVPLLLKKTTWKMLIKNSDNNSSRLKTLLRVLQRNSNIPLYVEWGMEAYLQEDLLL